MVLGASLRILLFGIWGVAHADPAHAGSNNRPPRSSQERQTGDARWAGRQTSLEETVVDIGHPTVVDMSA